MNWISVRAALAKGSARGARWSALAALAFWLGGCATTSDPQKDAELAQEQARQEALQQDFDQAVEAMKSGNRGAAKEQFQALHEQYPERTGPLANLGILAMEADKQPRARTLFERVVELDPAHAAALNHLGVIARKNGEFEEAERYYRQALAAEPDYLPAVMNLAILLDIYLGRPGEALPLYEQYQATTEEPHPRLKDWIFDARNRI